MRDSSFMLNKKTEGLFKKKNQVNKTKRDAIAVDGVEATPSKRKKKNDLWKDINDVSEIGALV